MMKKMGYKIAFVIMLFTASCKNKTTIKYDTPTSGTIHISVDESFKPIIKEQIKVFESSYPEAHLLAEYKSEADCFRDLDKDSTRMIIVAKGLTNQQSDYFKQKLSFKPTWDVLAYDAVSVIINANAKDSVFTLKHIQQLLLDSTAKQQVVVDGKHATSTVRFLLDSVLHGKTFGANVRAVEDSKAVINYVASNEDAIGFVGSSWVGDEDDPEQVAYASKIKFALVECRTCAAGTFAKPSQATITYAQYPLVRPLYYVLKENTTGLGTGFMNFMTQERGQLIFKRAYLVPAKMYFGVRQVI